MTEIQGPGKIVTIYIGNRDRWHGQSLYNAIVQRARERGMAGATVVEGIEGFGAHSRIHRASLLDISADLPIKVEIVDSAKRIEEFLPELKEMVAEGLIITRDCEIVKYVSAPGGTTEA
jgi:PII-like signaling protein